MSNELIEVNSDLKTILQLKVGEGNHFDLFSAKEPSVYAKTFLKGKREREKIFTSSITKGHNESNKTYSKLVYDIKATSKKVAEDEYYKSIIHSIPPSIKVQTYDVSDDKKESRRRREDIDEKSILREDNKKASMNTSNANSVISFKQPSIVNFLKK